MILTPYSLPVVLRICQAHRDGFARTVDSFVCFELQ